MKRFIGAVAVVIACLVMTGGAFAFDYTDHVSVAPNGKGDLLIFPAYFATGGQFPIQTEIKIVNSSATHSVVAKVVVRSYVLSQELLDFLIYLSPSDMWIGRLEYGPSGPRMVSTDKSGPALSPGQALAVVTCPKKSGDIVDSNTMGYVEVIEAWASNAKLTTTDHTKEIKANYEASAALAPYPAGTTIDMVTGSYEVSIPSLDWRAADNALTMKSYDNQAFLNSSVETLIGANARNTIHEVEASFAKNQVVMPFNASAATGDTLHLFTFPTKLSNSKNCSRVTTSGSNYADFILGAVKYSKTVYDNEENSITNVFSPSPTAPDMVDEMQILFAPTDFSFGWVMYNFTAASTAGVNKSAQALTYTGTPVIPTIVDFDNGLTIRTGAWSDGTVTNNVGTVLPYQYTSQVVTTTP
jgi:hypothetical protein